MQPSPLAAALERQLRAGSERLPVAAAVLAVWRAVDEALVPILGRAGVAAMYHRSLVVSGRAHPCLPAPAPSDVTPDLAALQAALAAHDEATAIAAGAALLDSFHDLLASLVGASVTDRLLAPVLESPVPGTPAQDSPA